MLMQLHLILSVSALVPSAICGTMFRESANHIPARNARTKIKKILISVENRIFQWVRYFETAMDIREPHGYSPTENPVRHSICPHPLTLVPFAIWDGEIPYIFLNAWENETASE